MKNLSSVALNGCCQSSHNRNRPDRLRQQHADGAQPSGAFSAACALGTLLLVLLGMLIVLLPSQAHSAVTPNNPQVTQIFQQLSATPIVRAQFVQHKKLASVNKTFVSNGQILFSKTQGVVWQIKHPVQADLVVTSKKVVQRTQRTLSQIEVQNSPYGGVASMFLQLMAGDQTALAKNFDVVSVKYTPAQWQVSFVPKSALFKKLFLRIDAQGQRYVDRLVITEKDNNSTTIKFSQQSAQPSTLTAAEHALFQLAK